MVDECVSEKATVLDNGSCIISSHKLTIILCSVPNFLLQFRIKTVTFYTLELKKDRCHAFYNTNELSHR